jgi:hypothetical protein
MNPTPIMNLEAFKTMRSEREPGSLPIPDRELCKRHEALFTAAVNDMLRERDLTHQTLLEIAAIYPQPAEINLLHFFWKELQMRGTRVYEPEDYDQAPAQPASEGFPLEKMITRVVSLEEMQPAFEDLDASPNAMKVLLK